MSYGRYASLALMLYQGAVSWRLLYLKYDLVYLQQCMDAREREIDDWMAHHPDLTVREREAKRREFHSAYHSVARGDTHRQWEMEILMRQLNDKQRFWRHASLLHTVKRTIHAATE